MSDPRLRLARALHARGVLRSPSCFDLRPDRLGSQAAEMMALIGDVLSIATLQHKFAFDCVAGIPDVGDCLAEALVSTIEHCQTSGHPRLLRLRTETKTNGTHVVGFAEPLEAGDNVLFIDGRLRTHLLREAVAVVQRAKRTVAGAIVVVGNPDDVAALKAEGIAVVAIYAPGAVERIATDESHAEVGAVAPPLVVAAVV